MPNISLHYPVFLLCFVLFGIGCGFSACLREIDLELPGENRESLAIRGVLKDGEMPKITVEISTLNSFFGPGEAQPVVGASVVLLDNENRGLDIPMRKAGRYELDIPAQNPHLEIKSGKSYQLSIATPDGKKYLSSLERLYPVPIPNAVDQSIVNRRVINETGNFEDRAFVRFLITTPTVRPDKQEPAYLKWDFSGTFKFIESELDAGFPPPVKTCYIFEDLSPDKVVLFDGSDNSEEVLRGFFLVEQPLDYRFSLGFYLTVLQQSLSKRAFQYWSEVGRAVALSGNFFDAPPGKVRGNFHNVEDAQEEVFGYFHATQEAVIRLYIPPADNTGTPICPPTVLPDEEGVPSICLDCRTRPGSTPVKPDFWDG